MPLICYEGGVVGRINLKQMGWHPILNVNSFIYVYVTCVYIYTYTYIYIHTYIYIRIHIYIIIYIYQLCVVLRPSGATLTKRSDLTAPHTGFHPDNQEASVPHSWHIFGLPSGNLT